MSDATLTLIPLPSALAGAYLVETQFRDGQPDPVLEGAWPLAGWAASAGGGPLYPVVVEAHGGLQRKQVSDHLSQTTGGSTLCFATRFASSKMDVAEKQRELRGLWRDDNQPGLPGMLRPTQDAVAGL